MSTNVFCTATEPQAKAIIEKLRAAGFSGDDISILMADNQGTQDFAIENETKAPEGAATGAGTGAVLGGALGWMAGIGALAIPGLGPFIAAGPIMAALGGAAVGGTLGGLTGALVGMGIPEYEAKQYEGKIKEGRTLISVFAIDSEAARRATEIYENAHAEDIKSSNAEAVSSSSQRNWD